MNRMVVGDYGVVDGSMLRLRVLHLHCVVVSYLRRA